MTHVQYVTRFLDEKRSHTVDVGYTAHPSLVTHEELAAVRKPFSISAAGTLFHLATHYYDIPHLKNSADQ